MNVYEKEYVQKVMSRTWIEDPPCSQVGITVFFAPEFDDEEEKHLPWQNEMAQKICLSCEHVTECGSYGILNGDEHGIWGSITPKRIRAAHVEYNRTGADVKAIAEREISRNRKRLNHWRDTDKTRTVR